MAKSHKTCMEQAEIIDTFGTYHQLESNNGHNHAERQSNIESGMKVI